jgi:hypothetical protein
MPVVLRVYVEWNGPLCFAEVIKLMIASFYMHVRMLLGIQIHKPCACPVRLRPLQQKYKRSRHMYAYMNTCICICIRATYRFRALATAVHEIWTNVCQTHAYMHIYIYIYIYIHANDTYRFEAFVSARQSVETHACNTNACMYTYTRHTHSKRNTKELDRHIHTKKHTYIRIYMHTTYRCKASATGCQPSTRRSSTLSSSVSKGTLYWLYT